MPNKKSELEPVDFWQEETRLFSQGISPICGCDEAGAGPLAGPVYAAAVVLPGGLVIDGLNDSKKLTEKKREALFDVICAVAEDFAIVSVSETEIDEINILNARMKAMDFAIRELKIQPAFALIDGTISRGISIPNETLVKGDSRSANIAAASILAKVSRDRFMLEMAKEYPAYHFEKHKGYGTKLHYEMLRQYGPCPIHRKTFLKKLHK
ncbi:MAG: ribonuclease HII [Oscillospiraceae bacterium]|jgi:ribonuclease HII